MYEPAAPPIHVCPQSLRLRGPGAVIVVHGSLRREGVRLWQTILGHPAQTRWQIRCQALAGAKPAECRKTFDDAFMNGYIPLPTPDFVALNALAEVRSISEGRTSAEEIRAKFVANLPPKRREQMTWKRVLWRDAKGIVAAARRRGWVFDAAVHPVKNQSYPQS